MSGRLPVTSLPDAPPGRRRLATIGDWGLRAAGVLLALGGVALTLLARWSLHKAAHPVDASPSSLRSAAATTAVVRSLSSPMRRFVPTGSIYARFDSTWTNQSFSVTGTSAYTDCYGSTPPAAPCTLTYFGSSGPQPGELPGAQAITVYSMGTSPRPGYVFLQRSSNCLTARSPTA